MGRDNVVGIVARLWAGRSGIRFWAGERDFSVLQNAQTGFGAHPISYLMGTDVLFWGLNGQGLKLTTHLHLVLSVTMSGGALLLHPPSPRAFLHIASRRGKAHIYLYLCLDFRLVFKIDFTFHTYFVCPLDLNCYL